MGLKMAAFCIMRADLQRDICLDDSGLMKGEVLIWLLGLEFSCCNGGKRFQKKAQRKSKYIQSLSVSPALQQTPRM